MSFFSAYLFFGIFILLIGIFLTGDFVKIFIYLGVILILVAIELKRNEHINEPKEVSINDFFDTLFEIIEKVFNSIGCIFKKLFTILFFIGIIASFFAMIASIIHFQILGALGFLFLCFISFFIFGALSEKKC